MRGRDSRLHQPNCSNVYYFRDTKRIKRQSQSQEHLNSECTTGKNAVRRFVLCAKDSTGLLHPKHGTNKK